MIEERVLKCPFCQTEEYLYATPTKHHVRAECSKEEGGCGRTYVIPNDGGVKIADNMLQQQLKSVPDRFFAGFLGVQAVGDELYWTLAGIVSEEKKEELENSLKTKVEILSQIKDIALVKYELKEYK